MIWLCLNSGADQARVSSSLALRLPPARGSEEAIALSRRTNGTRSARAAAAACVLRRKPCPGTLLYISATYLCNFAYRARLILVESATPIAIALLCVRAMHTLAQPLGGHASNAIVRRARSRPAAALPPRPCLSLDSSNGPPYEARAAPRPPSLDLGWVRITSRIL